MDFKVAKFILKYLFQKIFKTDTSTVRKKNYSQGILVYYVTIFSMLVFVSLPHFSFVRELSCSK